MNTVWWLIGTLGVGGTLLLIAVLVFGWPVLIGTKIGRLALAIAAGALAVFGIYLRGKAEGRAAERAKLKAITEKEVADAAAERARIDALTDEQVDEELALWNR